MEIKGNKTGSHLDVTAVVPTRGRYFTTLPLTLLSIAAQTRKPSRLIIYDDGERLDLRANQTYYQIFRTLDAYGIRWEVKFGDGVGQAALHNASISDADTEFIWRVDDDCVADPNALSNLYGALSESFGAVGGQVILPDSVRPKPSFLNGSLDDALMGQNVQWYSHGSSMNVQHLYGSFLYRKAAAGHGYRMDLSRACHREETIFTHEMWLAGWMLKFEPSAVTWHYHNNEGGIRDAGQDMFAHDDALFQNLLRNEWESQARAPYIVVLDNGIGDHYAFKHVLGDLLKQQAGRRVVLACCYSDVFHDVQGVELASIHDAATVLGEDGMKRSNAYVYMADNRWDESMGNTVEAFRSMHGMSKKGMQQWTGR